MQQARYLSNKPIEIAVQEYCQALIQAGCSPETVDMPILKALGKTTASAVYSRRSVPHFLASAMDGIALYAAKTFGATETTPIRLSAQDYHPVDTGDPLPSGCDAVIMIEDVINTDNADEIILEQAAVPWQHIRQIGEDFCAGDMLLTSNSIINPASVGLLAAGGINSVNVYRPLRVAIIPTGDEIVSTEQEPTAGQITESNGSMLSAALSDIGIEPILETIIPDDPDLLAAALHRNLEIADMVLLLAGSSAGRDDYSSLTISRLGQVILHGLAIKPGKPAVLGICNSKPVIGMPGYPVSTLTVFEQVVLPVLSSIYKLSIPAPKLLKAGLTRRLTSSLKYKEFIRVRLSRMNSSWLATPMERGAGMLASFLRADGILELDQNLEGLEAGSQVSIRLLPWSDEGEISASIDLIGSHDPLLDELADISCQDGRRLTSAHTGSMGGLMALRRQEALLAPIHLLDTSSGEYNLPDIRRMFPDKSVVLIEGFKRTQGLLVQAGNPRHIHDISDLTSENVRYVNRQSGAGTRILLDYLLDRAGIRPATVNGYDRIELTHTAVAAQIAAGTADTGLAVMSAAKIFELDFLPITEESYDFAVRADNLDDPRVLAFIDLISSEEIIRRLSKMGGYSWNQPGRIIKGDI